MSIHPVMQRLADKLKRTDLPAFVPGTALGLDPKKAAASERITLGVIGIGPRCKYVLGGILPMADVQCVAIADVQASRRDAGKEMVDKHYGNQDLKLYRDFREILDRKDIDAVLIATGDRWHGAASIMAAEQLWKANHRLGAIGLMVASNAMMSAVAVNNQRVLSTLK